ncbi:MAG TPA: tol-pal system protein YbgF [Methylotenera sp.]|jgi:tol-pal system protein YbgF
MRKLILISLFLTAQLFSYSSHAALFDDTEARKKIFELEKTMQSQNQATQATLAELKRNQQALEQRLTSLEAIAKNGLVDVQAQLETLKQENSRLKGDLELATHNLDLAQQRQKDLYTDTDVRLRKLESGAAPAAQASAATESATAVKESEEQKQLEAANALSKDAKHKDAFAAYDKFLKDYPSSASAADAMYGLGYSQFALKNYKSAIATQQKLLDAHPDSAKAPDAMMNMANSQIQLGQVAAAKKTLRELVKKFPNSEVTPTAQKRLKVLESIR